MTANGAVQPIEIKSRPALLPRDRIELAFYRLLLGDLRTASTADPAGWVLLRTPDGSHTRQRVELTAEVFAETEDLIQAVRDARICGVEPTWCRYAVCRGVRRQQMTEAARRRRDLSSVLGIGRARRNALLTAGYTCWDDLLAEDARHRRSDHNGGAGGGCRRSRALAVACLGAGCQPALKDVSEYFGITRESEVTSGLAAEMLWNDYQIRSYLILSTKICGTTCRNIVRGKKTFWLHGLGRSGEQAARRRALVIKELPRSALSVAFLATFFGPFCGVFAGHQPFVADTPTSLGPNDSMGAGCIAGGERALAGASHQELNEERVRRKKPAGLKLWAGEERGRPHAPLHDSLSCRNTSATRTGAPARWSPRWLQNCKRRRSASMDPIRRAPRWHWSHPIAASVLALGALLFVTGCRQNAAASSSPSASLPVTSAPAVAVPSVSPSPSHRVVHHRTACDTSLWKHVYHAYRLHVLSSCKTVRGTVEEVRWEPDGDLHILLLTGPGLVNYANRAYEHGDLVLEEICQGTVTQADAVAACRGFSQSVTVPSVGDKVTVSGSYVLDTDHGWREIHPVSRLTVTGHVAPAPVATTQAPPPAPSSSAPPAPAGCHPKTSSGNCYEPGEFCSTAEHGETGVAGDGKTIKCENTDPGSTWHWVTV